MSPTITRRRCAPAHALNDARWTTGAHQRRSASRRARVGRGASRPAVERAAGRAAGGIEATIEQMARHDVAERLQHRALDARVLALELDDQALDALPLQAEIAARRTAAADDRQLDSCV